MCVTANFSHGAVNETSDCLKLSMFVVVTSIIYIGIDVVFGILTNVLLMMTIYNSPSLRTPPNLHLLNIGVNNIMLCICMIFSLTTISIHTENTSNIRTLTGLQLFLVTNCSLQYLSAFASIGIYRNITMKKPAMCLRFRRRIVNRSISCSWVVSSLLSLMFCLSFMQSDEFACDTLNPFQRSFSWCSTRKRLSAEQMSAVFIHTASYVVGFSVVLVSYYSICKALNITKTFSRNKISPWVRTSSLSSDNPGESNTQNQQYANTEPDFLKPYTISTEGSDDHSTIVHYQKSEHTLAFEDIFALENPILAGKMKQRTTEKKPLHLSLSNTSTTSTRSRGYTFTDISPAADLQRIQNIKNASALRNQSLRRDRISLSSATKNSMIIFVAFIFCSLPLFICSIPGILDRLTAERRIIVLVVFRLLFYINACVYPTWYLIFSKRVRKCMFRVFETVLVRLHVRK